jgi:O-antigen/teichoic acid export membrane protein
VRPVFRLGGVGRLLRFGGAWSGARLAWQLTYQMDIVIAGRLLSQEAVGIYAVAMQLANIPLSKAMGIVNQVAFSTLSKLQDDRPRMRARMLDALRLLAIAAVPTLWGIGAVAPELVDVVLDDEWRRVAVPLQIIAIVAPLRIVSTIFATALSSAGRADVELINTLVSLAVFIAALLVGVRWNIEGLAIGYAVAVLLSFVLNLPRTTPIIDLPMSAVLMKCRSALMAGAVMIAAVAIARWLFNDFSAVARLVLLSVSGAVLYTAALHVLDRSALSDARRLVTAVRTAG